MHNETILKFRFIETIVVIRYTFMDQNDYYLIYTRSFVVWFYLVWP